MRTSTAPDGAPSARRGEAHFAVHAVPRWRGRLGYVQDDIVTTIVGLNLGVTERQIRAADSAWGKQRGKSAASASHGAASRPPAGEGRGGGTAAAAGGGGPHACLTGAGALRR